jgi:hypothetical protein
LPHTAFPVVVLVVVEVVTEVVDVDGAVVLVTATVVVVVDVVVASAVLDVVDGGSVVGVVLVVGAGSVVVVTDGSVVVVGHRHCASQATPPGHALVLPGGSHCSFPETRRSPQRMSHSVASALQQVRHSPLICFQDLRFSLLE